MSLYAVIMAGGEGTRLRPITLRTPKPLVPLAGAPVMGYALALLERHGVRRAGVTLRCMARKVRDCFEERGRSSLSLDYYIEDTPLGTAGSVRLARDRLTDPFLVLSGDGVTDCDLTDALRFHTQRRAKCTLVLSLHERAREYGVVTLDETGRVLSFVEKPTNGMEGAQWVNTGTYILSTDVLEHIPENTSFDFGRQLFPALVSSGEAVYGYRMKGYWCDVGNPRDYLSAQDALLSEQTSLPIRGNRQNGQVWLERGVQIGENVTLTNCYIASGAWIGSGARVAYASIGEGARVESGAQVERAVLMPKAVAGECCALQGAVLCEGARVLRGARIMGDSVLGPHAVLGEDALLSGGARVWSAELSDAYESVGGSLLWRAAKEVSRYAGRSQ